MITYAQMSQDIFALNFFNKNPGFFLDFGCGDGISQPCENNTLLLEGAGWDGLSVDTEVDYINKFRHSRKTKAVCADLTKVDIKTLLTENNCPKTIDYLSFDVDTDLDITLETLPLQDFKFKLVTFEHNLYSEKYVGLKKKAIEKFISNGYEILIENVIIPELGPVEDWFIHTELTKENKKIFLKDINHRDIVNIYGYDNKN